MRNPTQFRNKIKLSIVALTAAIALLTYYGATTPEFKASAASNGPSNPYTNAPGETNCTACHGDFTVNSGGGAVLVTGLPTNYTPGVTYPVTVTVNQNNATRFGFQTVALDAQGAQAGDYTLVAQTPMQTKTINATVNGNARRYVEHTSQGTMPTQFNTKSWVFNWIAPATRRGKVTFYAAGNGANSDNSTAGDYIYTGNASVCSGSVQGNFDGDNKADIAVWRPSSGFWYRLNSSDGQFNSKQFGLPTDKIVPGDFDGDGKNDIAVWRPSNGTWYITRSSDNGFVSQQFGLSTDIPVVGDYTGDGKSDLAVFRPSTGYWYTFNLVNNAFGSAQFGTNGDKPLSGDFDGDGKSDFAVFRPSSGYWYILRSTNSVQVGVQFGTSEDRAVPGDYDADGKTDYAVYRPSTGYWFITGSTAGFSATQFGTTEDQPVPNDYDGDCKTDIGVYRPSTGYWFLQRSTSGFSATQFGLSTDVAIPTAYTAQ